MDDFEERFLNLLVHERRHECLAAGILVLRDVGAQLYPTDVLRPKVGIQGGPDFADQAVMHVRPDSRRFQVRVHSGERRWHRVSFLPQLSESPSLYRVEVSISARDYTSSSVATAA